MQKIFTVLLFCTISMIILAQAPQSFNYQAVLRNDAGEPLSSQEVTVKVDILQGSATGTEVFTETHNVSTNEFGLVNLKTGSHQSLEAIDWAADIYFLQVSVNGTFMGTTQLLSVPYALHSKTAETVENEIDPVFKASPAAGIEAADINNWHEAYSWGNHAEEGFLTEETDPVFEQSPASEITYMNIENWNANRVPAGVINPFAGQIAPEGYLICDGSEVSRTEYADLFAVIGTTYGEGDGSTTFNLPDLQSRIPVGISAEPEFNELGKTGGAKDHVLMVDEMPVHSHIGSTDSAGEHNHGDITGAAGSHSHTGSTSSAGAHRHTGTTGTAGDHSHSGTTGGSGYSGTTTFSQGIGADVTVARSAGSHSHSFVTNSTGSHSHSLTTNTTGGHSHFLSITTASDHRHSIAADGNHTHTLSIEESGGGIAHNNLQPYIVLNFIIKY